MIATTTEPKALQAIRGNAIPYQVPSLSASPSQAETRLVQLLKSLEARRRALVSPQPSPWLMNSLLAANQASMRFPSDALLLLKMQEEKKNLELLTAAAATVRSASPTTLQKTTKLAEAQSPIDRFPASSNGKNQYVEEATELDILCGRGGKSNHWKGNKKYRQVVSEMKASYRNIGSKSAKTDLSRAIVEHVYKYGGRFLKMEKGEKKYVVLTAAEARKKTSQALREAKDVKWTS